MSLEIHDREHEGITILDIKGRLTVGPGVTAFRTRMESLLKAGVLNVILNMEGTDYIDSTGLGALVVAHTSNKKQGGAIKLLKLNRRNIELLVMTKLATIFEIFNDEQDSINSFYPDRKINTFDILSFVRQMKEE